MSQINLNSKSVSEKSKVQRGSVDPMKLNLIKRKVKQTGKGKSNLTTRSQFFKEVGKPKGYSNVATKPKGPPKREKRKTHSSRRSRLYKTVKEMEKTYPNIVKTPMMWNSKGSTLRFWREQLQRTSNNVKTAYGVNRPITPQVLEAVSKIQSIVDHGVYYEQKDEWKRQRALRPLLRARADIDVYYQTGEIRTKEEYNREVESNERAQAAVNKPFEHKEFKVSHFSPLEVQDVFLKITWPTTSDHAMMILAKNYASDGQDEETVRIVTPEYLAEIIELMIDPETELEESFPRIHGSDKITAKKYLSAYELKFRRVSVTSDTRKKKGGKYFPYTHNTNLDLRFLQVYNTDSSSIVKSKEHVSNEDFDNGQINCFISTLKFFKLSDNKIDRAFKFIQGGAIRKGHLKKLSKLLNIQTTLEEYTPKCKTRNFTRKIYNKGGKGKVHVGLINDHYFPICPVPVNFYALNHYEEVKDDENWTKVFGKKRAGKWHIKDAPMMSHNVLRVLYENKDVLLTPIATGDLMKYSIRHFNPATISPEKFTSRKSCPKVNKRCLRKWNENFSGVFAIDTEASAPWREGENMRHEDYCGSLWSIDPESETCKEMGTFSGDEYLERLFDLLPRNNYDKKGKAIPHLLFAHNLKYDMSFIQRLIEGRGVQVLESNGRTLQTTCIIRGRMVTLRDSSAMITRPLRDFGGMFNLTTEKDVMPYGAYNKRTLKTEMMTMEYAKKHLKNDVERKQFEANVKKLGISNHSGKKLDHMAYARYYCSKDTEVLALGYLAFRKQTQEGIGLETINFMTAPSLADTYLIQQGCYEDVFELDGPTRQYIQACNVGGRTMLRNNEKQYVKCEMDDLMQVSDVSSLYPAAMDDVGKNGGYLKGRPKHFNKPKKYSKLASYDGYFAKIDVINVPIRREMPLISVVDPETKSRNWTNDYRGPLMVDKCQLEDLQTFHGMVPERDFTVLEGYYFNSGRNPTVRKVIRGLYNKRMRFKGKELDEVSGSWKQDYIMVDGEMVRKPYNAVESIYKLIMNSGYGKRIMRPITVKTVIVQNDEELHNLIRVNHNRIIRADAIGGCGKWKVKISRESSSHKSTPQVGSEILSHSKHIMNKMICTAEDLGLPVYYTDTDSMHLKQSSIDILAPAYKEKYGETMQGNDMGRVHNDFDDHDGMKALGSRLFIGCRKKVYFDDVVYKVDENGVKSTHAHTRMKGVSEIVLKMNAEEQKQSMEQIYTRLYNNESLVFDMAAYPKSKCCFGYTRGGNVYTRGRFTRTVRCC